MNKPQTLVETVQNFVIHCGQVLFFEVISLHCAK